MSDGAAVPQRTLRGWLGERVRSAHLRFFFRHQLRWQAWLRVGRHHAAPIDPLRTLTVDPRSIDRWVDMKSAEYRRIRYSFDVRDGDWDLDTRPLSRHFVYASLEAHFVHGAAWEATELYALAMRGIHEGTFIYHGCRSRDDLTRRLEQLDALYDRLRHGGYRSQRDLARSGDTHLLRFGHRPPELDEVVVHIGRDGGFILVDGVHRFSIARSLGLEAIPVIVLHRHAHWQARRDEHARAGYPALESATHPDLSPPRRGATRRGETALGSRTP